MMTNSVRLTINAIFIVYLVILLSPIQSEEILLTPVYIDNNLAYINPQGEVAIETDLDYGGYFYNGIALAHKNNVPYLINTDGEEVFGGEEYSRISFRNSKLAYAVFARDENMCLPLKIEDSDIDRQNLGIIGQATGLGEGYIIFKSLDGQYGVYTSSKTIRFGAVSALSTTLDNAVIAIDKQEMGLMFGVFNLNGDILLPFSQSVIVQVSEGFAVIKENNQYYSLKISDSSRTGPYSQLEAYYGGYAAFAVLGPEGERWGFLDHERVAAIPPRYSKTYNFSQGFACVLDPESQKWKYIDESGETIFGNTSFESASQFIAGLAVVELDGMQYLLNRQGTKISLMDKNFSLIKEPQ